MWDMMKRMTPEAMAKMINMPDGFIESLNAQPVSYTHLDVYKRQDYCSMKQHEDNARAGDLFTTADRPYGDAVDTEDDARGHVIDLVAPVLVLIAACILGLIYTGGFFEGVDFITAFSLSLIHISASPMNPPCGRSATSS